MIRKLTALLGLALVVAFALPAQSYPNKAIQVVVPANPGGDTDLNARIMSKYLEKELGQPVIIVNVGGAGGSLGSRRVKDAAPDGYTALFFHPSMFLNKIMGIVDYSFQDFENGGMAVMDNTNIFVVNAASPYRNLQDIIKASKDKPRSVKFATETGGFTHLQILAFQAEAGIQMNVVDTGTASQKIVALLGRQVDVIGISYGIIKDYVASGRFRVIGVMSDARNPMIPQVPTFKEQGVDLSFPKFFYYLFPKGTPQAVVNRFSSAVEKVSKNAEAQAELNKFMVSAEYMNPAEAFSYMTKHENVYLKYKDLMLTNRTIPKEAVKQ